MENLAQFVGERMLCVVTEANPERRNLVLSRRAVLEREQQEAKEKLLAELAPGQVRDGVVRNIRDFGAFVDLGGVDGLLHVSQLSWARVKHPSEVLQLGQPVKVKIQKIDPETGKISLAMKELTESPWTNMPRSTRPAARWRARSPRSWSSGRSWSWSRAWRGWCTSPSWPIIACCAWRDVVSEGQEVEVIVTVGRRGEAADRPVDQGRAGQARDREEERGRAARGADVPPPRAKQPKTPLKGGIGRGSGGDKFGLKW